MSLSFLHINHEFWSALPESSHAMPSENECAENATLQIKHVGNGLWLHQCVLTCHETEQ